MLVDDRVMVVDGGGHAKDLRLTSMEFECYDEGCELVGSMNDFCNVDMNYYCHHQDLPKCVNK